jgi:hypothetical protein
VQRLSRYASQGRTDRAAANCLHPNAQASNTFLFICFRSFLTLSPRRVYLVASSAALASLAARHNLSKHSIYPTRLDTGFRPSTTAERCLTLLRLLPETSRSYAFACRNALQQTVKGDELDVVVVVCIPPASKQTSPPGIQTLPYSVLLPTPALTQASHHQILLCRHAIITGSQSLASTAD